MFLFTAPANATGVLQSMIKYYTENNGTDFVRSSTPFSGTESQVANPNGSVTMNINNAPGYADSGFVIYDGKLGDLNNFSLTGIGDEYGLNLWFDTNKDGEFFAWNPSNVLTELAGDTYGLGPSSTGVLSVDGSSQFGMMTGTYGPYTLAQLKSGAFIGINSDTHIAIWVGVTVGSGGSKSATVNFATPICMPTGFTRDGKNMTAALINPAGTVSGDVNATGCNIGVYYDSTQVGVDNAQIHGANYFGVLVDGDNNNVEVDVKNSSVFNIGETPFNGTQHGVAIYYRSFYGPGSFKGTISNNQVYEYQKGGITVNGNGSAIVNENTVTGLGPVPFIAQNGIQFGWKAKGSIYDNVISGNHYTGGYWQSAGILLYDVFQKDIKKWHNVVDGNQAGQLFANAQASWMR